MITVVRQQLHVIHHTFHQFTLSSPATTDLITSAGIIIYSTPWVIFCAFYISWALLFCEPFNPMKNNSIENLTLKFFCPRKCVDLWQFCSYTCVRGEVEQEEKRKMNQIDILRFGFLHFQKGSHNLSSRFSNKVGKGYSL